jgi:DNA-binding response OmpR family regulator
MANILVVEDDDSIRRLLLEFFQQRSGSSVIGARDGADALHELATREVDVVVLDLMMPYMSGVDFLVSLSAIIHDPTVGRLKNRPPIVVITGAAQDDFPSDEIQGRFPEFVRCVHRKPLDMADLARCVEAQLAASH